PALDLGTVRRQGRAAGRSEGRTGPDRGRNLGGLRAQRLGLRLSRAPRRRFVTKPRRKIYLRAPVMTISCLWSVIMDAVKQAVIGQRMDEQTRRLDEQSVRLDRFEQHNQEEHLQIREEMRAGFDRVDERFDAVHRSILAVQTSVHTSIANLHRMLFLGLVSLI